jgi:RimJ/RimL family protein N-acetyltransferase
MTARLADTPVLETERLTLRAPQMADWEPWRAFVADDRSTFIRGGEALDLGRTWRAFAHVAGMWALRGCGQFVFCRKGSEAALGMSGPWHPIEWPEPEIGWTVWSAEAEGQGYAFEAARRARDFAFEALGWETAVSYVHPDNARSIALARRLGAFLDTEAEARFEGSLVYRHPRPEARA